MDDSAFAASEGVARHLLVVVVTMEAAVVASAGAAAGSVGGGVVGVTVGAGGAVVSVIWPFAASVNPPSACTVAMSPSCSPSAVGAASAASVTCTGTVVVLPGAALAAIGSAVPSNNEQ